MRATCPTYLMGVDLITLLILHEEYGLWRVSLGVCNSLSEAEISSSGLCSQILSMYVLLFGVTDPDARLCKITDNYSYHDFQEMKMFHTKCRHVYKVLRLFLHAVLGPLSPNPKKQSCMFCSCEIIFRFRLIKPVMKVTYANR